ncbi:MAG: LpxL/LpxP family Kdo(2)-lipid IV(A) lauroyl/palmitoleoyl acyltransferase [Gammaproteobacteria bacterium]
MSVKRSPLWFLKYYHPKFWITWFGLGILRIFIILPYPQALRIGSSLGVLAYHIIPKRRHITSVNIALCFPELSPQEQAVLVKNTFRSAGMGIIETALSWWASQKKLLALSQVSGLENIHKALKKQNGIILYTAHTSTLEIGGALMTFYQPILSVYKKAHNQLFEEFLYHSRTQKLTKLVQTYELRTMIKSLNNNEVAWYAADQDFGMKQSVFAPFMGVETATLITPARIAKMTGAAIVPFFCRRLPDNKGYLLEILPEVDNFPSGDDVQDATQLNQLIADAIKKAPEQYFWAHRRFKTRPPGEPDVYAIKNSEV